MEQSESSLPYSQAPAHSEQLPVPNPPDDVIKVELMKNFVTTMDQTGKGFLYWKNNFPMVTLQSRKRHLQVLK